MTPTMTPWQPYREPLRTTFLRTAIIAVAIGAVLAFSWHAQTPWGRLARWPVATLLALWPSFGGHWVEILFLNGLRPRLSANRPIQIAGRLCMWFIGGAIFAIGMRWTAQTLVRYPAGHGGWLQKDIWIGGLAFIGVELIAHLPLQWRGFPSFYNGRG